MSLTKIVARWSLKIVTDGQSTSLLGGLLHRFSQIGAILFLLSVLIVLVDSFIIETGINYYDILYLGVGIFCIGEIIDVNNSVNYIKRKIKRKAIRKDIELNLKEIGKSIKDFLNSFND